ncbi:hypothetical protein ACMD2_26922, partial [Ananas comosus]
MGHTLEQRSERKGFEGCVVLLELQESSLKLKDTFGMLQVQLKSLRLGQQSRELLFGGLLSTQIEKKLSEASN